MAIKTKGEMDRAPDMQEALVNGSRPRKWGCVGNHSFSISNNRHSISASGNIPSLCFDSNPQWGETVEKEKSEIRCATTIPRSESIFI